MRGTRARQIRRDALPADLLADAKQKIREAAIERTKRTDAVRATYRQVERVARNLRDRDIGQAYAEFNELRAEIMREAQAQADARQAGAEAA